MAPPTFLGPPELYETAAGAQKETEPSESSNDFVDLMVAKFNTTSVLPYAPRGYTANGSGTFTSSGNPCVDFFFHVVPDSPPESIRDRLVAAWSHDASTALKLIFHLRGVRGTGKSDREGFYEAALWLHGLHPKSLALNVAAVADFGYFKDLPELLYRLLEGSDVRKRQKEEWEYKKLVAKRRSKFNRRVSPDRRNERSGPFGGFRMKKLKKSGGKSQKPKRSTEQREIRIQNAELRNKLEKEQASLIRHQKSIALAESLLKRYNRDPDFKFLYDRISDFFADRLRSDLELLRSGETSKISLAAKWCPTIDSAFDRSTLLCEAIARKIFTRESHPEYDAVEESHYGYRVRDRLRKEVLVPLRKALELPEIYMGAKQWSSIPYNRVSSVAMNKYKEQFVKHDEDRFMAYLADVKAGKATIAAGNLLPHEIIASLRDAADDGLVAELQWKRMVSDLLAKGKLSNCVAICGVHESMAGDPIEVSVALGLLVSELSDDPWRGKLITFSESPELHVIQGSDLYTKTEFVRKMKWGQSTNFQKVFDLILKVAVSGKVSPEKMVRRVFVFSDMDFEQASAHKWETDYECIVKKYEDNGYGSSVPEIVFWNLKDSEATPVPAGQRGVALVSGFSENMMKLFLDNDGAVEEEGADVAMEPEAIMRAAISGEEYQKLVVVD